jgi:hypothetical protein
MKIKQFRSILAVAIVAASITTSLLPAQAIPLDGILDSAGKSFVRGMFGLPPEQQETPQSGGFNNDKPQPQTTPANPVPQQNSFNPNPNQSLPAPQQPSTNPQQQNIQTLASTCISANGNYPEVINRDSLDSTISVGRRPFRVFRRFNLLGYNASFQGTCRILRHPSSEKVRVGFGIPDNSNLGSARVSIYVDGQEKASGVLVTGQARAFTADIAGASSYAVVVKPLNGDGYIYSIPVKAPL